MNIKQAAELFNLTPDTLHYYERVGVIPPVTRNKSGYRDYQTRDLNWIYLVKNLRGVGLPIESLISFCALSQVRDTQYIEEAQKQILNEQLEELDERLAELQQAREVLEYKIATYDDHMAKFRSGERTDDDLEKLWEEIKK
ncbi:MerR family transcriptional regulator [Jeotgalibaca sp. PTS2502]|uniref:MerR family transcriptional regulator n=1 Tax=Jeotgalibaca sp. PTS2502 TaxID=1903686 RepID=UPI000973A731|nr:MerR family transcriptional regulator [Jeotgalibaca sp. PTS2502]APZ49816.1 MerR family transcriptional regulator [Jeotgalibaca sp. PTS2502]